MGRKKVKQRAVYGSDTIPKGCTQDADGNILHPDIPVYDKDGNLPPGWGYEEPLEGEETITGDLIAKATMEGENFVPKNAAQEALKKEIAETDGIVDIPQND